MRAIDQQTAPKITSWQSDYERVVDGLAGAQTVVGLDEVAISEERLELFVNHTADLLGRGPFGADRA